MLLLLLRPHAPIASGVSFFVQADFTGSFEDISDTAYRVTHSVGRQTELDRTETGSSVSVLDNHDRAYDPSYTGGPHYPNLLPGKKIRHQGAANGAIYDLFLGAVDPDGGWPQNWSQPLYHEVSVRANDGFAQLSRTQIPSGTAFPEELSGARLHRLLDLAGWPPGQRLIDDGQETIQGAAAGDLDGQDILQHAFDVAVTEPGFVFVDGSGFFVFHDRHHRLKAPYTVAQAVFSDNPGVGEFLYSALTMQQSKIINVWRVTRSGGVEQVAEDDESIDANGGRLEESIATLHVDDVTAFKYAQWRLSQTKDPRERFVSMLVEPLDDEDLWAQVFARSLGDRVTVKRTPPGAAEQIVQDGHIEAISRDLFSLEAGTPSATWALSPADQQTYWLAGEAGFSEAGVTTRAVF